jgi:hypothetical protein
MDNSDPIGTRKKMQCIYCSAEDFDEGSLLLNTRTLALLGLEIVADAATYYRCRKCGFMHLFMEPETPGPSEARHEDVSCLKCGATISADSSSCAECGWSYLSGEESNQ